MIVYFFFLILISVMQKFVLNYISSAHCPGVARWRFVMPTTARALLLFVSAAARGGLLTGLPSCLRRCIFLWDTRRLERK
jgi:hypothetical protein